MTAKRSSNGAATSPPTALANEWVQCKAAEQVVQKLQTPRRDGATELVKLRLDSVQPPTK